jgi:hypothetical protein
VSCNPSHLICPLNLSNQVDRFVTKGFVLLSTETGELQRHWGIEVNKSAKPDLHMRREKEIS